MEDDRKTEVMPPGAAPDDGGILQKIGRYEVKGVLGKGAMGLVYEGWQEGVERKVAIKTLQNISTTDAGVRETILNEARMAGNIIHPNIVQVYDAGEENGVPFVVMEFVDGTDLEKVFRIGPADDVGEVVESIGVLCSALDAMHDKRIFHSDLKPANIFRTNAGELKIGDFGLSGVLEPGERGGKGGTLQYMSPEQLRGQKVDRRSDLYALGVVAYEWLTGRPPFQGTSRADIKRAVLEATPAEPRTFNPRIKSALNDALLKAIARRPEERFFSGKEMAVALRGALVEDDAPGDVVPGPMKASIPIRLPYHSLGDLFVGRTGELEAIGRGLAAEGTQAIVGVLAHGLGGVGKTRLAVEYAWRNRERYSAVLFVTAESGEKLQSAVAGLCAADVLDLPEQAQGTEEPQQAAAAVKWMNGNPGWLLILDNVDDRDAAHAAQEFMARVRGGQVIVTGRYGRFGGVSRLELTMLAEEDAVKFLLNRTAVDRRKAATDAEDARELAKELGGLALALEQAGAYVAVNHAGLGEYLAAWRAHYVALREWHDGDEMKYPRALAVTWETTLARLRPGSVALLRLLAWFAPEPVPGFVFEGEEVEGVWRGAAGEAERAGTPREAVAELINYSLLQRDGETDAVAMHRVLQEIVREGMGAEERADWIVGAMAMLWAAWPGDPEDVRTWPKSDLLRPHVEAAAEHGDSVGIAEPTWRLMNALGMLLYTKALHGESERYMCQALMLCEAFRGSDHPDTAICLNNLALLLQITNRLSDAEPLMRRALEIDEKFYGPEHVVVAIRLNNLAQLLKDTNRLPEAGPVMRRVVDIFEKSYGSEHPNLATSLSNLAQLLMATNRLPDAEPLMRRALEIDEKSYGLEHPSVASSLSNLAQLLMATNRLPEAEPLIRRALEIDERSYGPEHPDVATILCNLAELLKARNRLSEVEPLMRRALAIREKSYGPEHPDVANSLNSLSNFLMAANRLSKVEPLMRRALAIREKSGSEHPDVAKSLGSLSSLLMATNRLSEAEPLMRRALEIDEKSYGPEHPEVATDLNNLAQLLGATNRLSEAKPLMRRVVEIFLTFTKDTGHAHPHLRRAFRNYAGLLVAKGRSEAAAWSEVRRLAARWGVNAGLGGREDSGGAGDVGDGFPLPRA